MLSNGSRGALLSAGAGLMYRFTLGATSTVTLSTTGATSSTDTFATLLNSACQTIETDDDGGGGRDFRIARTLTAGTYYLQVRGFDVNDAGNFTLNAQGIVGSFPPGDIDCDGIPDSVEPTVGTNVFFPDNDVFNNNRLFVMQTYRDFLLREGDIGGINFWTNVLNSLDPDAGRIEMVTFFLDSPEFVSQINTRFPGLDLAEATVTALYVGMLARDPDLGGRDFWANAFRVGVPRQELILLFIASQEYFNRFLAGCP